MFNIVNGPSDNVIYYQKSGDEGGQIRRIVKNNDIHIVLAPEARLYAGLLAKKLSNVDCEIVTALHSMPGYDRRRLHVLFYESFLYNKSILKRVRAGGVLLLFPLFYLLYFIRDFIIYRKAYSYSTYLILLCDSYISEFSRKYLVDSSKLRAICNPISFDFYANKEIIDKKKKKILIVARFDERAKRLMLALKIWSKIEKKYPDWSLEVVGYGRSLPMYLDYIKRHNLTRVSFLGKQPPIDYYKDASIFMMTSAYEGWGMTIVEAMQMGCVPIVMNSFSAVQFIIDNGVNGYIINNIYEYTTAMENLMINSELRDEIAYNAVIKAHTWEPDKVCSLYKKLFDSILLKFL